ncbi:threonine synthase [Paenactinomyces guangxiensis]|uniref:Threonine synthase n=1 Tax=Paenactinomyces guangxiensis TaxID=1490290 RepID=A0A7W2A9W9_9BACL|nr:threonine synthase [Paenactinomyces guangxiensis]MBA4496175.1 threonine synthase [Paenactinomyces guangxiensis]MBH8593264.1 threonine synthase [Paenactinomyces guangxiensis]
MRQGILEKYRYFLPITDQTPSLTLYEGETPLLRAEKLSEELGADLYLKWEGANPTGSFKDRGMVLAIAKAKEDGSEAVMCASTGNTSASAAAYAAKLGMKCYVVVPHQHIALGKMSQAVMYGAEVLSIQGNFDQALAMVREITDQYPITLVNSVNPYRIEGQKTAAFEVCQQLGEAPDILAIPVGNAGNISAYWKGFVEFKEKGHSHKLPRMWGFEAEGAAAIVRGEPVLQPETVATAIRIGNPASWKTAVQAAEESNGAIDSVTDEEILAAYSKLARLEGIFCEPASAASVAGVIKMRALGNLDKGARVVCVLTGNGLKDPNAALAHVEVKPKVIPCDKQAILDVIKREEGLCHAGK